MATNLISPQQAAPAATTETALYTCGAANGFVASSFVVCNRSNVATTFRAYIAVAGVATANKQYLYYDTPIGGNQSFILTGGITMLNADVFRVYAGAATLSFTLCGQEST